MLQRRIEGMPAEARAFDARRILTNTRESRQLTELGGRHRRITVGRQRVVHEFAQMFDRRVVFSFDRFSHERCRGGRNRATLTLELDIDHAIAFDATGGLWIADYAANRVVRAGGR